MQKPSEFFAKLEAEQAVLGFEVFLGDDTRTYDPCIKFWDGDNVFKPKPVEGLLHKSCIYIRPIPKPAPAPFVDLPLDWEKYEWPSVVTSDKNLAWRQMPARPGLLHVVDGRRYRLERYVYKTGRQSYRPFLRTEGEAVLARFYLEGQP
jgi:hypothetical protein